MLGKVLEEEQKLKDFEEGNEYKHIDQCENHQIQQKKDDKLNFNSIMFGMMASAMGTGIFNLPLRVYQIGILPFVIYVLVGGYFSTTGAMALKRIFFEKKIISYGQMSERVGGKGLKKLSEVCLIIFPFGIAICYQVILVKFLLQLLSDILHFNFYEDRSLQILNSDGEFNRKIFQIGLIILAFSLIALQENTLIQKLSSICVVVMIINAMMIFYTMLFGFNIAEEGLSYPSIWNINLSKVNWWKFEGKNSLNEHLQAFASILFCFVNHQLVFPACQSAGKGERELNLVFIKVNVSEMVVYLLIGISGYLALIEHLDTKSISSIVLASFPLWYITIGKGLLILSLYIAIPLNFFPARTIIFESMSIEKSKPIHYTVSSILAASTCTIAIIYSEVNAYFGLLGGTAGVLMGIGIPSLCYAFLMRPETYKQKIDLSLSTLVTIAAVSGGILSVM